MLVGLLGGLSFLAVILLYCWSSLYSEWMDEERERRLRPLEREADVDRWRWERGEITGRTWTKLNKINWHMRSKLYKRFPTVYVRDKQLLRQFGRLVQFFDLMPRKLDS